MNDAKPAGRDPSIKRLRSFVQETASAFATDRVPELAAALSYYTVFSLPPLLVIALAISGAVFGDEAARGEVQKQIRGLIGEDGGAAIQAMIENARREDSQSGLATGLGFLALFVGSTTVFAQLQTSLNAIWGVKTSPSRGRISRLVSKRLLSFGIVVGVGFLLLVSLLVSAALSAFGNLMRSSVPETAVVLVAGLDFVLSQAIITFMLAALYSILPDANVPWRVAWVGGGITALLFVVGKWLIGFYLGRSAPGSAFGAAGSLAVVLIWIYYSSIVFFSGAEITKVYAKRRGNRVRPEEFAVKAQPAPAPGP